MEEYRLSVKELFNMIKDPLDVGHIKSDKKILNHIYDYMDESKIIIHELKIPKPISNIIYKYFENVNNIKFTYNINGDEFQKKRDQIDIITGFEILPDHYLYFYISGGLIFKEKSDCKGEIKLNHPIIPFSCIYNEFIFEIRNENDQILKNEKITLECINIFNTKNHKKLFISSKNIKWKFSLTQKESYVYYRGILIDDLITGYFG